MIRAPLINHDAWPMIMTNVMVRVMVRIIMTVGMIMVPAPMTHSPIYFYWSNLMNMPGE